MATRSLSSDAGENFRGAFAAALLSGALPGETDGMDAEAREAAAIFLADVAAEREAGRPAITAESITDAEGARRTRLAVINDDMPFLVDSIAALIGALGLDIHRLLHPVLAVRRDEAGRLAALLPAGTSGARRESMIYVEMDRADAKLRRKLIDELRTVLADVRAAVGDWPRLQIEMRDAAEALPDGEGAALLRWLVDRHFTLLGHRIEARDGTMRDGLGLLADDRAMWSGAARAAAIAWFEAGGEAPLVMKADHLSTVHRRAPMDMLVLPVRGAGGIEAVAIHAGLWTSAALAASSGKVPILRARLTAIEEKYGFDPAGHAGKALRHALSILPHDLLVALPFAAIEQLALTAMSLADRPRPKLILAPGALNRHLFAFAWLPRDELSTARRTAIGAMLEEAAHAKLVGWAIDLGDSGLALIRYMLDLPEGGALPDAAALDKRLEAMVRGWVPAVEAALAGMMGATQAARLVLAYAAAFPLAYRGRYAPEEAARDMARLHALDTSERRSARLYRAEDDGDGRLHLKTYRLGGFIPLSDAVPVLENFGFRVLEENPTPLDGGRLGYIHDYLLELSGEGDPDALLAQADIAEQAIAAVLEGRAENDAFNQLVIAASLPPATIVLFRAWFRYLRQTGLSYGLDTVASALRRAPIAARRIADLFVAQHDPRRGGAKAAEAGEKAVEEALAGVSAIDDDRILRRLYAVVSACLRTNAFATSGEEALAFKLDSGRIPGLPAPRPWREIWVYSPRVEGVHLRGGPVARGGLRWSDRRDDFRTEILGLMKAQVVKNAVIVPTGAKGGFYPKQLPSAADRDAWLAEGTESYRIFIRALLSLTDNIVEEKVVHPQGVVIRDEDDPYFVVAADKGTAAFSDVANAIALDQGFWLGDAFASGGSHGYDHKEMGITARGAWISVTRHFAEMGVDVTRDPVTVVGCGDMSGDVFGNGMLLSKSLKLIAAFDHRHIFLDPDPDPAKAWAERKRLFDLPRSSWADYAPKLISPGGGVFPRTQKAIPLSPEIRGRLGIEAETLDPSSLIAAILKAPVDLLWFGGIGTYVKARAQSNDVGDHANDAHRVDGEDVRAKVVGEGANLGVTQQGRIAVALAGGRINTDFIDNSAGVDCSDNEVNIKIPLNREMREGRLDFDKRNALLASMTEDVAALVLEDNRLQTLALSLAERGGAGALPTQVRVIEILEASGRLDRAVEGLVGNKELLRRAQDGHGLTRPELAVLLSHGKLALQEAIERSDIVACPSLEPLLLAHFPAAMQETFRPALLAHRLRGEIVATAMANRLVNRLGIVAPFELAEEGGTSLAHIAACYFAAEAIYDLDALWHGIETATMEEGERLSLLNRAAAAVRLHVADLARASKADAKPGEIAGRLGPGIGRLARRNSKGDLAAQVAALEALDGAVGIAELALALNIDERTAIAAYNRLGEAMGLDWAKTAALAFMPADPWERLLIADLLRDFEQLRLDFLERAGKGDPRARIESWIAAHAAALTRFRTLIDRARASSTPSAAMLARIASQARALLSD